MVRYAMLAAVVVGCAACAGAVERVFTRPTVTMRGVRAASLGLGGSSLEVTLSVANPNPYRLTAKRVTYRLFVRDSVEVGSGTTTEPLSVPGRDSTLVRLPLDVSWAGLRAAGRDVLADGTVAYRMVGDLVLDTPIGDRTLPFDERGRFAALRMPGGGGGASGAR